MQKGQIQEAIHLAPAVSLDPMSGHAHYQLVGTSRTDKSDEGKQEPIRAEISPR